MSKLKSVSGLLSVCLPTDNDTWCQKFVPRLQGSVFCLESPSGHNYERYRTRINVERGSTACARSACSYTIQLGISIQFGPDVLDIYDGLPFTNEAEKTNVDKVIELLEAYFIGETNEIYEAYLFNQRVQEVGESFDSFLTALRTLAKTCNFGNMQDRMIRDRVVVGIKENSTRKKLLIETKLTLNKCIDICRANENTAKQLKDMTQTEEVSAINTGKPPNERPVQTKLPQKIKCKFCHKFHLRKKELCPAWQQKCSACGEMNHFSAACRNSKTNQQQQKKRVHNVEESLCAKHDDV